MYRRIRSVVVSAPGTAPSDSWLEVWVRILSVPNIGTWSVSGTSTGVIGVSHVSPLKGQGDPARDWGRGGHAVSRNARPEGPYMEAGEGTLHGFTASLRLL